MEVIPKALEQLVKKREHQGQGGEAVEVELRPAPPQRHTQIARAHEQGFGNLADARPVRWLAGPELRFGFAGRIRQFEEFGVVFEIGAAGLHIVQWQQPAVYRRREVIVKGVRHLARLAKLCQCTICKSECTGHAESAGTATGTTDLGILFARGLATILKQTRCANESRCKSAYFNASTSRGLLHDCLRERDQSRRLAGFRHECKCG